MSSRSENKRHGKKTITDVGRQVPSNFKFGVIVAIAIFWADFLRSVLNEAFSTTGSAPVLSNFVIAVIASVIGYLVMLSYRRIQHRLKKLKF